MESPFFPEKVGLTFYFKMQFRIFFRNQFCGRNYNVSLEVKIESTVVRKLPENDEFLAGLISGFTYLYNYQLYFS